MSKAKCVCGHERIEHQPNGKSPDCGGYRPVLDWPDAEGWWFAELGPDRFRTLYKTMALATLGENGYGGPIVIRISTVEQGTYYRDDAVMHFGPMKFSRPLEPNPFATNPTPEA